MSGNEDHDEETIYLTVKIGADRNDVIKCPLAEKDLGLGVEKIVTKAIDYARSDPKQDGIYAKIDIFLNTNLYKSKKYNLEIYINDGRTWAMVKKDDKLDMEKYLWTDERDGVGFKRIDIRFSNPPRIS